MGPRAGDLFGTYPVLYKEAKGLQDLVGEIEMKILFFLCVTSVAVAAPAEGDALKKFRNDAKAAKEAFARSKGAYVLLVPIIKGLISKSGDVRAEALEILRAPYLQNGWISVEHFERIGWESFDANGKGAFLWCAAHRKTGGSQALGSPLKTAVTVRLWKAAAQEPVPLPFMKETAVAWLRRRSGAWNPVPLGDNLAGLDRTKFTRQYLSILKDCKSDRERTAVVWMVLDLHAPKDTTLEDWYSAQADSKLRATLLETLNKMLWPPPKATDERLRIIKRSREALEKRKPVLKRLAKLGQKDWDNKAATEAKDLEEATGRLELLYDPEQKKPVVDSPKKAAQPPASTPGF